METFRSRLRCVVPALLTCLLLAGTSLRAEVSKLPRAEPESVGMCAAKLAEIHTVVAEEIQKGAFPGCVVAVGRHGKLALLKAYGQRQLEPAKVPMTIDTLFDLASVTKPVATATSVMILVDQGKLELDEPVAKYVPDHPDWQVLGHLGHTGTSVRFSPDLDLFVVFLSNRVHPKDPGSLTAIVTSIRRVWETTVEAAQPVEPSGRTINESSR